MGVLTTVCKVTWRELQVRTGPWKGVSKFGAYAFGLELGPPNFLKPPS